MASIAARLSFSAHAKERSEVRRLAFGSKPAATFFPLSAIAVVGLGQFEDFFVRRESDRKCGRRRTGGECTSAPGSFSSARRDNRENHPSGNSARCEYFFERGNPLAPDHRRSGCGARRFARLRDNAK